MAAILFITDEELDRKDALLVSWNLAIRRTRWRATHLSDTRPNTPKAYSLEVARAGTIIGGAMLPGFLLGCAQNALAVVRP